MRQALITGASSDIGIATCKRYLKAGFKVVGHYHKGQPGFFDLAEMNSGFTPIQIDMGSTQTLEVALEKYSQLFLQSDVLINMAAVLRAQPFAKLTSNNIMEALQINLLPGILLSRDIAPRMMARSFGRIVNISSVGVGFGGGSASFSYALSKHAMEFLPSDHKDWAAQNVFVNNLRIGVTDTRIHQNDRSKNLAERVTLIPAKRMATVDEIANAIYWYGSEENTFTTGQTIAISGGE